MQSSKILLVVVTLVVAAGLGLAGLNAPAGDPAAGASGPSTGQHRTWAFASPGWIDIAYNVTPELDPDDIHIEVSIRWGSPPSPETGATWMCYRYGNATPWVFPNGSVAEAGCYMRAGDGEWEYRVEHGSRGHGLAVANPGRQVGFRPDGHWTNLTTDVIEAGLSYDAFRNASADPVLHWTIATGGYAPERIAVDAAYRGTSVNVTHGPSSDAFTYYREDFDARRAVRADLPGHHWSYQANASLATELERGPGPTFLLYDPLRPHEWNEETVWYVQPDGWRRSAESLLVEVSAEDGRWRFGFSRSDGALPDRPVLMGAAFRWASLPGDP